MQVNPTASASPLRLVRSAESVGNLPPRQPITEVATIRRTGDRIDFESVYRQQLPRVQFPQAFHRLERIRANLVGASVDQPIHFDTAADHPAPANPYAPVYLKLSPAPADVNESATRRQYSRG